MILALAGTVVFLFQATPIYSASVKLFVSTPVPDANLGTAYDGSQFGQERVKSYAEVVSSPAVTQPVIEALHLKETPAQLGSKISASAPLDTVLLNVSVRDRDKERAATVVNALGLQLVTVVQRLETPSGGGSSPVRVSIVKNATTPSGPVSPEKKQDLALGLLLGLFVGLIVAVIRERLDTSIKTAAGVQSIAGTPTLGFISVDDESTKRPLVVVAEPKSPTAEGFRQLRTNLQFVNVDDRPKSLVITSSVASEGKSTIAANLALAMAEQGQHVLLIDGDLRKPRVANYFGIEGAVGLTTILSQRIQPREVIQKYGEANLSLLPSGQLPPNPSELLGSQEMSNLLIFLESHYDMVLIDAPPLRPVADAAVLASVADGVLLIVRHGSSKRDELARSASVLKNVDANLFGCVLNMTPAKGPESYYYYRAYYNDIPEDDTSPRRGRKSAKAPQQLYTVPNAPSGRKSAGTDLQVQPRRSGAKAAAGGPPTLS